MPISFWFFLYILVLCLFAIRIFIRKDLTPPARLAWIMVLITVPYVGGVLYFLFGEARFGKKVQQKRKDIFEAMVKVGSDWTGNLKRIDSLKAPHDLIAGYATSINGLAPIEKNQASLMKDSAATMKHLIRDIDGAKKHVHVLYFIWLSDNNGTAMAEALIRASKRGVICRVMIDGLGSRKFKRSKLWKQMKKAGVKTQVVLSLSNPIKTALFSRIDLRNHRKITVIDNQITYCGSQNCADPEFQVKAKYAPWVDIMVRVTGPVVAQNQILFATDWMYYHPEDSLLDFLEPAPKAEANGLLAQIVADGPTIRRGSTSQLFTALITSAKENLTISTPYFVPNTEIVSSLMAAAHRGVSVNLILPARNDSWVVGATSRSHYHSLLESGVQLYEYTPGLLHAKTLTIDGEIALIGSSNLDIRSFDLNYENNILFYDATLTNSIYKRQKQYISDSNKILLTTVDHWSKPRRIWYNIVATMGPIL